MHDANRVRNLVMLGILLTWMMYLGASILRGEHPEKWTWGIVPGVYVALFRPGMGKGNREVEDGSDEQRQLPARRRAPRKPSRPAEDTE